MLARTPHTPESYDQTASRLGIGGNRPPIPIATPSLFEGARKVIAALSAFLRDHPVITNAEQARAAKAIKDGADRNLADLEAERDAQVRPLNEQVAVINARYKSFHNTDSKRPGSADKVINELKARMLVYVRAEEARRAKIAEEAARVAAAAEAKARAAEADEKVAIEDAAAGVCDIDIGGTIEQADQAFSEFLRADRAADRAARETHVKIGGGMAKSLALRTHEVLSVADWKAAIEDIGLTPPLTEAILTAARAYRKANGELPDGISSAQERSL